MVVVVAVVVVVVVRRPKWCLSGGMEGLGLVCLVGRWQRRRCLVVKVLSVLGRKVQRVGLCGFRDWD